MPDAGARKAGRRRTIKFGCITMSVFFVFVHQRTRASRSACSLHAMWRFQRGFGALSLLVFTMVIALALIVLMTSSRLSSPLGQSKSRLQASALIEQASALATAFTMADSEAALSAQLATFDDGPVGMLNVALTGTSLPVPPPEALQSPSFWRLQRSLLFGHGTAAADVGLQLPYVSADVCAGINQLALNSASVPALAKTTSEVMGAAAGTGVAAARTHLAGADMTAEVAAAFPGGVPSRGCLRLSDGYLFFMVIKTL